MNYCCENAELARKQRVEIVLMTKELNDQEDQLNSLLKANLKQKDLYKTLEKKKIELEKSIKSNDSINSKFKDQIKGHEQEIDNFRKKLKEKDLYIQNQSTKLIKLQASSDRSIKDLDNINKKFTEIKSENAKLNIKSKEQTLRIIELKEKNLKNNKDIDSKNNLIQTSAEHINTLEKNLKKLVEFMDKTTKENKNSAETKTDLDLENINLKEISLIGNQSVNHVSWTNVENSHQNSNINKDLTNDKQLQAILVTLKENWLESNLKYEEVKNLLMVKMNESKVNTTTNITLLNNTDQNNDLINVSRMATSSPINQ